MRGFRREIKPRYKISPAEKTIGENEMKPKFNLLDGATPYRYWSPSRIIREIQDVEVNEILTPPEKEAIIGVLRRWLRISEAIHK